MAIISQKLEPKVVNALNNLIVTDKNFSKQKINQNLSKNDLTHQIFNLLTSTKFRKSKLSEEAAADILKKISDKVHKEEPIQLILAFGNYKQARLESAPLPDWAEIFNLSFILQLATSIGSVYQSGVVINYLGQDAIVKYIDNYKQSDIDAYSRVFSKMIAWFNQQDGDRNIKFKYSQISKAADISSLIRLMEENHGKQIDYLNSLPDLKSEEIISRSLRNQCWDGEENLTGLSDKEKYKRAIWAAAMHCAFLEVDPIIEREYFEDKIFLTLRKNARIGIHCGSCSSSTVQFWAGEGFLSVNDDSKIVPWILSAEQQEQLDTSCQPVSTVFDQFGLNTIKVTRNFFKQ